ncbi:MAG: TetR/AcrR family transcriptional regulator [Lachnospiraceae bacterium]|nr:TetR/AcrR family transcriptional regulator [Lachnospiraceae bacterium]MBD5498477.1 TetR/AcrR family transcriptional regulator [Lachnospiraceae bacterium]
MDKRKEENIRVKKSITEALFKLMHEKSFSDISITEIIRSAKVARASFYRNYDSKENVLLTLIENILEQFRSGIDCNEDNYYTYQNVYNSFAYFKKYGNFLVDLYLFGYGSILLEKLNQFHEEVAGTMPNSSIERYKLYMYMGALFNTAIIWIQNGAKESIEDITDIFCRTCGIPAINTPHAAKNPPDA